MRTMVGFFVYWWSYLISTTLGVDIMPPCYRWEKPKLRLINLPEISVANIAECRLRILEAFYHLQIFKSKFIHMNWWVKAFIKLSAVRFGWQTPVVRLFLFIFLSMHIDLSFKHGKYFSH